MSNTVDQDHEQVFLNLLDTFGARLHRIASHYARPPDAEDLYQEILLQLWRSLPSFAAESKLETWAYRVALNTALSWRRRKPASTPVSLDSDVLDTHVHSRGNPTNSLLLLEDFLAHLGSMDRALLLLYLEDLSYRQIAEITGSTESTVGIRLNRIKKTFEHRYLENTP